MAFTPPYHGEGILSRAINWCYLWADEPQVRAKYKPSTVSRMLSNGLDQALLDLYNSAQYPPRAAFNVTLVADQERYMLPGNIQQIHRVACIDTDSGLIRWEIIPRQFRDLCGPNILFEGFTSFRIIPIPQVSGDIITIEYTAGGPVPLHQNALISRLSGTARITSASNVSTCYLMQKETPWLLGNFDRRANAFIGCTLRLLGTHNDVGAAGLDFFPVQERVITAYDIHGDATAKLEVSCSPSFDSAISFTTLGDEVVYAGHPDGTSWLVYEVLPNVDAGVMTHAVINTALDLCSIEGNEKKIRTLTLANERLKRAVLLRWANAQTINSPHYERDPWSIYDDSMPC